MAGNLPLVDFVPLVLIILTVAIAFFALYKYLKIEKTQTALVIGIAFLLLTISIFISSFLDGKSGTLFYDNDLGGIGQYLQLLAYIIFLLAVDPMKVINDLRAK